MELNLIPVSFSTAKAAYAAGRKIYATKGASEESILILSRCREYFRFPNQPWQFCHDGDLFVVEIEEPTRAYYAHGHWNAEEKKRQALIDAAKVTRKFALDERDVLRDCPLRFVDPTNKFSPAQRAHYGAFCLFLNGKGYTAEQKPREILSSLATSYSFKLTDCGEFQPGVRKILFGKYAIYMPLNAA